MRKSTKRFWEQLPHPIRWVIAATVGSTLFLLGLLFLVLPGPGLPLIIAGLAILATEFTWAEVTLAKAKHHTSRLIKRKKN